MNFFPIGMRAKCPADGSAVNTCSDNDSEELGDETRWSWSNPTNRRLYAQVHFHPSANHAALSRIVSIECAWQGLKIPANTPGLQLRGDGKYYLSTEAMFEARSHVLFGNWRAGKGKRPLGHWIGPDVPLITEPAAARRAVYLPAYESQIGRMLGVGRIRKMVEYRKNLPEKTYLRDFDTGYSITANRPMSHAYLLAHFLNYGRMPID